MAKRETRGKTVQDHAEEAARKTAARQVNAGKQKRFRESMKAEGFKQVLLWALPCPADVRERMTAAGFQQVPAWEIEKPRQGKKRDNPGMVRVAARVHESSLGIADKTPEIKQAFSAALGAFLREV